MLVDYSNADLSFAGCGFMCVYHAGVSAALKEYAPHLFRNRIYGASAGAIAAAALICNVCISEATSAILQVICEARSGTLQALSPTFDLMGLARDGMERMLPEDAHVRCTGRLHISLTRYDDCKNVVISEFCSKEDLIQAVICSCYIPWFCGFEVPSFHGVRYIDGGFSDNQPKAADRVAITVSPFSGESDVCPMDMESASLFDCFFHNTSFRLTTSNMYRLCSCFAPPAQDICSRFCRQGFTDALRFLTKNAITPCVRCLTVQSNVLPMPVYGIDQLKFRRRLDSECGLCLEKLDNSQVNMESTALFPAHLQQTLDEMKPSDSRLYDYFCSLRIVRFSTAMLSPVLTPIQYTLMFLKVLNAFLNSKAKKDFFMERVQEAVDLLLKEIEERNLMCTPKFSLKASAGKADIIGARATAPLKPAVVAPAKRPRGELAQIYETDDHVEFSAYVNDRDSVSRMVEYAEQHNAVLAFHYMDTLNEMQVCEIFDMDRVVPRVKCHSTAASPSVTPSPFADYYDDAPPSPSSAQQHHHPLTRRTLSSKRPITLPLTEEEEDEEEANLTENTDEVNHNRIMDETMQEGSTLNESEIRADFLKLNAAKKARNTSKFNGEVTPDGGLDRMAEEEEDSSLQNVPPDPDASTPKNEAADEQSSNLTTSANKRDACCSPVRQFKSAATRSAASPSLGRAGGAGFRPNLRAAAIAAQQRATRRHTTIGVAGGSPVWSSATGARKLASPFLSSRSLAGAGTSLPAGASLRPSSLVAKQSSLGSAAQAKTVHSSDSDDEVEDDDALFRVSNNSRRTYGGGGGESTPVIAKDGYDGESDMTDSNAVMVVGEPRTGRASS